MNPRHITGQLWWWCLPACLLSIVTNGYAPLIQINRFGRVRYWWFFCCAWVMPVCLIGPKRIKAVDLSRLPCNKKHVITTVGADVGCRRSQVSDNKLNVYLTDSHLYIFSFKPNNYIIAVHNHHHHHSSLQLPTIFLHTSYCVFLLLLNFVSILVVFVNSKKIIFLQVFPQLTCIINQQRLRWLCHRKIVESKPSRRAKITKSHCYHYCSRHKARWWWWWWRHESKQASKISKPVGGNK